MTANGGYEAELDRIYAQARRAAEVCASDQIAAATAHLTDQAEITRVTGEIVDTYREIAGA
ncbi:hypothetical protein ACFC09_36135 [Streptomyces sp. NPDC056161]|uniref:hypothetical protein n=1 Tax=Streptomyces sp. NPDC056161 TaxID=3345732 RepID=UPI0035D85B82